MEERGGNKRRERITIRGLTCAEFLIASNVKKSFSLI